MSRLELSRGNKGLWQRIEALQRSMLPRQARVTRTDGHSVWVKFLGDGANDPESQFPSTVAGVPVATMGWVLTLGGKKGLFIATGTQCQTHSHSENTSPGGENLTGVGTYSTAGVLRSGTLQSYIPAITSGLWDVDIEAHALVYRSVATGGVYLFVGNGTASYQQALGRLSPQTHAYTLNVNVSPSIGGGTALKAVGPGQVIDMRYTGFQTAGTTYVINHGWKITARRVG